MRAKRRRQKSFNRAALFAAAEQACTELRLYLAGELQMSAEDLEAKKGIIRQASRISFYFFSKKVLGYTLLTNKTHKKWCEDLQTKWLDVDRFMRLKPRGTYKTTLYGICWLLWVLAVVSPQIRFFYTSANQGLLDEVGAELDRHIGGGLEDSLVSFVFGLIRDPNKKVKNTTDVFNVVGGAHTVGRGFGIILRTAGGSTNGIHPNFIIIDDPMDKADRESLAVRTRKERWYGSLVPLLVPLDIEFTLSSGRKVKRSIQKMMFIATRWHLQDLVSFVRAKNIEWDFEEEGVYTADGGLRYPEFFGAESIKEKKDECTDIEFACWYLNNPLPEGMQRFREGRLHFVRREQVDITKGTNYCLTDPSSGKEGNDFPATIWINVCNGRKVVFAAIDDRVEITELLAMTAKYNAQYKAKVWVVETNGALTIVNSVKQALKATGYRMRVEPIHETRNKNERISAIQPDLYNGGWYFVEGWERETPNMRNQIIYYPAWGNDDFPDVLEKGVKYVTDNLPPIERIKAMATA